MRKTELINLEDIIKEIKNNEDEVLLIITKKHIITKDVYENDDVKKILNGVQFVRDQIQKQIKNEKDLIN